MDTIEASSSSSTSAAPEITFKTVRKRNLRQRKRSEDDDNQDDDDSGAAVSQDKQDAISSESAKLAEARERQRLRQKPNGVNIIGLAIGKKITIEEQVTQKDPFNRKTGGMVNMQALKASGKPPPAKATTDEAYDVGIGTQFSAETNKRDEDEEMMKYIEDQLSKRKAGITGDDAGDEADEADALKYMTPEEAALMALPDHLRVGSANRSEEMLSNQMLNGIPEVDLGIEAKIRNIEATEAAKEKLLQDQKNKADGPSHFVPTNMAVNFVQHNRFNLDPHRRRQNQHHASNQSEQQQQQRQQAAANNNRPGGDNQQQNHRPGGAGKPGGVKRATDDYHYDKFKKQFRRY